MKRGTKRLATVTPLRRTKGLRPVSEHRREVNEERERLQVEAWGPRPWTCRFNEFALALLHTTGEVVDGGRCFGRVDGHEILWRGRAGRTDANLLDVLHQVPLCSHHNSWVDTHPLEAKRMGLARSAGVEEDR